MSGISRLVLIVDAYPCLIDWCGLPVGLGWGVHDTKAFLGLRVVDMPSGSSELHMLFKAVAVKPFSDLRVFYVSLVGSGNSLVSLDRAVLATLLWSELYAPDAFEISSCFRNSILDVCTVVK